MTAICNGTDLSALMGYDYTYEIEPVYGGSVTTLDGRDHTAKIRDRVVLTVPFIHLTGVQLQQVLSLFPEQGAYVSWTFTDKETGLDRTVEAKYEGRSAKLRAIYRNGKEYWAGLTLKLRER